MKAQKLFKQGIITSLCGVMLVSCFNDVDLKNINNNILLPETLVFPVGSTKMTLKELLEKMDIDDMIDINDTDNEVYVTIKDEVTYNMRPLEFGADEFEPLDFIYDFRDETGELPGASWTFSEPLVKNFLVEINGDNDFDRIDSVRIANFVAQLTVTEVPGSDIDISKLKITTEFDKDNAVILNPDYSHSQEIFRDVFTPGSSERFHTIQRNNILFIPSIEQSPGQADRVVLPVTIIIEDKNGTGITVTANSAIGLRYDITNLDWEVAYGDFPPSILGEGIERHDFDISELDGMKFYNPQILLTISSNIGSRFIFDVDYIKSYFEYSYEVIDENSVRYALFDNDERSMKFPIDNRSLVPGQWGEVTLYQFDRNNGNTHLLFSYEKTPNVLEYAYSVQTATKSPSEPDRFITPEPVLAVSAEARIPLYFSEGSNVNITDTISELDLNSNLPEEIKLEKALLTLITENALPPGRVFG